MPKIHQMFPSKYLKAGDCDEGDLILTVASARQETIGQGADANEKWVLYFDEIDKGLVLNKTNATTIAKLYGNDTDDWVGRQIALFATEVQFGSEMVESIRVRLKAPKAKPGRPATAPRPAVAPMTQVEADGAGESDDDIPF